MAELTKHFSPAGGNRGNFSHYSNYKVPDSAPDRLFLNHVRSGGYYTGWGHQGKSHLWLSQRLCSLLQCYFPLNLRAFENSTVDAFKSTYGDENTLLCISSASFMQRTLYIVCI